MSMHLFEERLPGPSEQSRLRLLCAYENGSVMMWERTDSLRSKSVEGIGWSLLWTSKLHAESGALLPPFMYYCLSLTSATK